MMALTHTVIGVGAYGALALASGGVNAIEPLAVLAAAAGSLAPDLDHPSSWLGRRLLFISLPLSAVLGHRGLTHSFIAVVITTAYLWGAFGSGVQDGSISAFALGYLLHLLADWNTNSGIPLLWPACKRYKAPWAIQTGGVAEFLFLSSLSALILWQGVYFIF